MILSWSHVGNRCLHHDCGSTIHTSCACVRFHVLHDLLSATQLKHPSKPEESSPPNLFLGMTNSSMLPVDDAVDGAKIRQDHHLVMFRSVEKLG